MLGPNEGGQVAYALVGEQVQQSDGLLKFSVAGVEPEPTYFAAVCLLHYAKAWNQSQSMTSFLRI